MKKLKGGIFITLKDIQRLSNCSLSTAQREHRTIRKELGLKTKKISVKTYCKYIGVEYDLVVSYINPFRRIKMEKRNVITEKNSFKEMFKESISDKNSSWSAFSKEQKELLIERLIEEKTFETICEIRGLTIPQLEQKFIEIYDLIDNVFDAKYSLQMILMHGRICEKE